MVDVSIQETRNYLNSMTTHITSPLVSSISKGAVLMAAFAVMAAPALTHAASYAYVHQTGNVSIVIADTWMAAIATAPGIAIHSGVLLLDSLDDSAVVGDNVNGV